MSPPSGRCRAPACRPPCLVSQPWGMHALWRAVIRGASRGPPCGAPLVHASCRTRYEITVQRHRNLDLCPKLVGSAAKLKARFHRAQRGMIATAQIATATLDPAVC